MTPEDQNVLQAQVDSKMVLRKSQPLHQTSLWYNTRSSFFEIGHPKL